MFFSNKVLRLASAYRFFSTSSTKTRAHRIVELEHLREPLSNSPASGLGPEGVAVPNELEKVSQTLHFNAKDATQLALNSVTKSELLTSEPEYNFCREPNYQSKVKPLGLHFPQPTSNDIKYIETDDIENALTPLRHQMMRTLEHICHCRVPAQRKKIHFKSGTSTIAYTCKSNTCDYFVIDQNVKVIESLAHKNEIITVQAIPGEETLPFCGCKRSGVVHIYASKHLDLPWATFVCNSHSPNAYWQSDCGTQEIIPDCKSAAHLLLHYFKQRMTDITDSLGSGLGIPRQANDARVILPEIKGTPSVDLKPVINIDPERPAQHLFPLKFVSEQNTRNQFLLVDRYYKALYSYLKTVRPNTYTKYIPSSIARRAIHGPLLGRVARESDIYENGSASLQKANIKCFCNESTRRVLVSDESYKNRQVYHVCHSFPYSECSYVENETELHDTLAVELLAQGLPLRKITFDKERRNRISRFASKSTDREMKLWSTLSKPPDNLGIPFIAGVPGPLCFCQKPATLRRTADFVDQDGLGYLVCGGPISASADERGCGFFEWMNIDIPTELRPFHSHKTDGHPCACFLQRDTCRCGRFNS